MSWGGGGERVSQWKMNDIVSKVPDNLYLKQKLGQDKILQRFWRFRKFHISAFRTAHLHIQSVQKWRVTWKDHVNKPSTFHSARRPNNFSKSTCKLTLHVALAALPSRRVHSACVRKLHVLPSQRNEHNTSKITYRFLLFLHSSGHLGYCTVDGTVFSKIRQFLGPINWKSLAGIKMSSSKWQLTHLGAIESPKRPSKVEIYNTAPRVQVLTIFQVPTLGIILKHFVVVSWWKLRSRRIRTKFLFRIPFSRIHHGGKKRSWKKMAQNALRQMALAHVIWGLGGVWARMAGEVVPFSKMRKRKERKGFQS